MLEDSNLYPHIYFWMKKLHLEERARHAEFARSDKALGRKGRKHNSTNENLSFWHFEHPDGMVLDGNKVRSIRRELKKIWRELCERYGPEEAPWLTISLTCQLKFYIKIEEKFPIL